MAHVACEWNTKNVDVWVQHMYKTIHFNLRNVIFQKLLSFQFSWKKKKKKRGKRQKKKKKKKKKENVPEIIHLQLKFKVHLTSRES